MKANDPGSVARDHFATLVVDWSQIGPPLRPSPADSAVIQRIVTEFGPGLRAVVLGLTPEIIGCTWPASTDLTAIDHSPAMVAALWHPDRAPAGARAIVADWRTMPIASGTVDLVAGDGCSIVLRYPEECAALTQEVQRILRPGGRFVIRVFLRPDRAESIAEIAAALADGRIGSVHALKLRLLAALAQAGGETRLDDVWHAWKSLPPPPATLTGRPGWTSGEIAAINAYRGLTGSFYLPTLDQIRAVFHASFAERECTTSTYELGERCPTFDLERHPALLA